jgi:hypothetical protein
VKKSDIKTGIVYAYQRGDWDRPQPLVFLSLDLYKARSYSERNVPWCSLAGDYHTRPKRGEGFDGRDVGYPVIILSEPGSADSLAAMAELGPEVITAGLPEPHTAAGMRTDVLTRLASVTGTYEEVVAELAERRRRDRELEDERRAEEGRTATRREELISRFAALGVKVTRAGLAADLLTLSLDEAAKIADRLEG